MKTKHGINISATAPSVDGAKSLPKKGSLTKCDRCEFQTETKEELVKHLDSHHVMCQRDVIFVKWLLKIKPI